MDCVLAGQAGRQATECRDVLLLWSQWCDSDSDSDGDSMWAQGNGPSKRWCRQQWLRSGRLVAESLL